MKRLAALWLLLPLPVIANNPFQCVDPVYLNAFLGHWGQNASTYSTNLPPDFVPLNLPKELVLVGSQTSDATMSVVVKSDQRGSEALASALDALPEEWRVVEQFGMSPGGFQTSSQPSVRLVCRDTSPGMMNIMARTVSDYTLVSFAVYAQQSMQTCDAFNQQTRGMHRVPLMKYMPTLSLPSGTKTTNAGSGGSGDEMSSRVVVATTQTRDEILAHLGEQIQKQKWLQDTEWSGSVSSGSVWSRSSDDDSELLGVLRITQAASDVLNIRFSVSPVSTRTNTFGSGSISVLSN